MSDIFTSKPAPGAVLRNWTHKTLTVEVVNALGETFYFEVEPDGKQIAMPKGGDTSWGGKCQLDVALPIAREV